MNRTSNHSTQTLEGMPRIEPKTFFANERTFLKWLHTAVTLGSIGGAMLGFAGPGGGSKAAGGIGSVNNTGVAIGMMLLVISGVVIVYAIRQFNWRARMIKAGSSGPYADDFGPCELIQSCGARW